MTPNNDSSRKVFSQIVALASLALVGCSSNGTSGLFDGDGGTDGSAASAPSPFGGALGGGKQPSPTAEGTNAPATPQLDAGTKADSGSSASPAPNVGACKFTSPVSANPSCNSCAETSCCAPIQTCMSNADCAAFDNCLTPCGQLSDDEEKTSCVQICVGQHQGSVTTWQAAVNCLTSSCSAQCGT